MCVSYFSWCGGLVIISGSKVCCCLILIRHQLAVKLNRCDLKCWSILHIPINLHSYFIGMNRNEVQCNSKQNNLFLSFYTLTLPPPPTSQQAFSLVRKPPGKKKKRKKNSRTGWFLWIILWKPQIYHNRLSRFHWLRVKKINIRFLCIVDINAPFCSMSYFSIWNIKFHSVIMSRASWVIGTSSTFWRVDFK